MQNISALVFDFFILLQLPYNTFIHACHPELVEGIRVLFF